MEINHYLFCFYIPQSHCDAVKNAIFAVGAGRFNNYEQCCWQTQGVGQFKPLSGSQPHTGEVDTLETVAEIKVEVLVAANDLAAVIAAFKQAHPYEEPAYQALPVQI